MQLEQLIYIAEKADRHVAVDSALMLNKHEIDAVQRTGYIIFQATEKAAVQSVDCQ